MLRETMSLRNSTPIYLSGSIVKVSDGPGAFSWSETEIAELKQRLSPLRPQILNPSLRADDLADPLSTFGRDALQVKISKAVMVDARSKRGVGIGAEMMLAKMLRIPVVSVAPVDSHYRRRDITFLGQGLETWTHPFIASLSDFIAEEPAEAAEWVFTCLSEPQPRQVKGPEFLTQMMEYYLETQVENDPEMHGVIELLGSNFESSLELAA
jgi:hypothetical protein